MSESRLAYGSSLSLVSKSRLLPCRADGNSLSELVGVHFSACVVICGFLINLIEVFESRWNSNNTQVVAAKSISVEAEGSPISF